MVKLFIDDLRALPFKDWTLCRTNTDAIRLLATGHVEDVSLDHDIIFYDHGAQGIVGGVMMEETFKPIAYYLSLMPNRPRVLFHTANIPAGREMAKIIGCEFEWWQPCGEELP